MKWIIIKKRKRQPGEPVVEIYGYWRSGHVPLPKIFLDSNGYVIQWSDGTREFVPCAANPLEGVKEFVLNYIGGMLAFRFKPIVIVDADIYKEFVELLRPE